MRAVLQRVRRGRVLVEGETIAAIEHGLVILIGAGHVDTAREAEWLAEKCVVLRVFEDEDGKTNLSLRDVGGEVLVVSQFTLYADTHKGRRPSFVKAAPPEIAEPLVDHFVDHLRSLDVSVQKGVFGAHMLVEIENDGPVTIILERDPQS